ncbi:glycosyltransferase family 2 protein [Massilia sp. W12]|uniref:glycosyltransferase family 2 protein n=1 Tax=Massilia sp. W12 TaxID=3126507 RepID=UPI0030CC53D2
MSTSLPVQAFTAALRPAHPVITCITPAYNEAAHIRQFLLDLSATLQSMSARYEIVVVNDGSRDATESEVLAVAAECSVRYLGLSRNFGKEAALSAGIEHARGDVIILMDSDYQHPLRLLPEMLGLWRQGYDMVYGVIADRRHESGLKRAGTNLFYRLMEAGSALHIPRNAGDFRLMDAKVGAALRQLPERNRFMKGLYAWVGFKSVALPFVPEERASGQSSFSMRGLARLAVSGLTAFTTLPLRFWSAAGAMVSIGAILYGAYVALETLIWGNPVPGWATLVCGLMFFSGVQLLSIGVLGEYLGRVYEEVKKRPLYLVGRDYDHAQLGVGGADD